MLLKKNNLKPACPVKLKRSGGFTLLEVLLVVAIIAILVGITIFAFNPARQLGTGRNAQRMSDLEQINAALDQYFIKNFHYPRSVPTTTLKEICDTGNVPSPSSIECTNLVDLSELVPDYLAAIPKDPLSGGNYKIMKDANEKIILTAPNSENKVLIAIGTSTVALASGGCDVTVTGANQTTSGNYAVQTFTGDGTFTVNSGTCTVEVYMVGGGGGGSSGYGEWAGGGGGGAYVARTNISATSDSYDITVGAKGLGATSCGGSGNNGGASSAFDLTAGGGNGATQSSYSSSPGGTYSGSNGNDAGSANGSIGDYSTGDYSGAGGDSGKPTFPTSIVGSLDGGTGATGVPNFTPGTHATGFGGGGSGGPSCQLPHRGGGDGAPGIVIIRYSSGGNGGGSENTSTLGDGLVAHYLMNDTDGTTVKDETGNNNGTGTYTSDPSGRIGKGTSLNGSGDTISFSTTITNAYSTSMWVNVPTVQTGILISSAPGYGWIFGAQQLYIANGDIYYANYGSVNGWDVVAHPIDSWFNVILTFDGVNTTKIYLNGLPSGTYSNNDNSYYGPWNFGSIGSQQGSSYYLLGSVDDVRIYNRVLNSTEISELAAGTEAE